VRGVQKTREGVWLMEIFGIPVVFTLRDILSLGGFAIIVFLMAIALVVLIPLEFLRKYMEWRNKNFWND